MSGSISGCPSGNQAGNQAACPAPRAPRPVWKREAYENELMRLGPLPEAQRDIQREPQHEPQQAAPPLQPVFIVGHPRSGTNWAANLLNLHPELAIWGELHFQVLLNAMPELVSEPHTSGHTEPVRSALARGFQDYLRSTLAAVAQHRGPGAKYVRWVGDHTPRLLRPMLPEAHHILMVRDGRDVAISLTVHLLNCQSRRVGQSDPAIGALFERALGMCSADDRSLDAAADWLLSHEAWVKRVAGNWERHVLGDEAMKARIARDWAFLKVMTVRYEDLHADTPGVLRQMFDFLGADPARAQPIDADPRTRAGFSEQTAGSHYRKGQTGEWRTRLSADARAWFAQAGQRGLEALKYERDASWVTRGTAATSGTSAASGGEQ